MDCPRRERLIWEWDEAVVKFADCVGRLTAITGDNGFAEGYQVTELARLHAENARMVVELHRAEDGC